MIKTAEKHYKHVSHLTTGELINYGNSVEYGFRVAGGNCVVGSNSALYAWRAAWHNVVNRRASYDNPSQFRRLWFGE